MTDALSDSAPVLPPPLQQGGVNAIAADGANAPVRLAVVVEDAPANLAVSLEQLTRNLVLQGTAFATATDQITLKTSQGDLSLKPANPGDVPLQNFLPATVAFQIRPTANGVEAVLITINRTVVDNKIVAQDPVSSTPMVLAAPPTIQGIPTVGQVLQATVLAGSPLPGLHDQTATPNRAATNILNNPLLQPISIGQNSLPSTGGHTAAPQDEPAKNRPQYPPPYPHDPPPNQPQQQKQGQERFLGATEKQEDGVEAPEAAALPNPTALATPFPYSGVNTENAVIRLQVVTVTLPESVANADDSLENGRVASRSPATPTQMAVVWNQTPAGQPLLAMGDQMLAVKGARDWPLGMQLELSQAALPYGAVKTASTQAANPFYNPWAGLQQALTLLAARDPVMANNLLRTRLANVEAQNLPAALLLFFAALRQNKANAWLGESAAESLDALAHEAGLAGVQTAWENKGFLANAFDHNLASQSQWQGIHVPYYTDSLLQHFTFYLHRQADGESQAETEARSRAKRFLIEITFSRLGAVQLEGLSQPKKLTLILRTDAPLPEPLRQDLQTHFITHSQAVGLTGNLLFQSHKANWITLHPAAPQQRLAGNPSHHL